MSLSVYGHSVRLLPCLLQGERKAHVCESEMPTRKLFLFGTSYNEFIISERYLRVLSNLGSVFKCIQILQVFQNWLYESNSLLYVFFKLNSMYKFVVVKLV